MMNILGDVNKHVKELLQNEKLAKAAEKDGKNVDPKDTKFKAMFKELEGHNKAVKSALKGQSEVLKKLNDALKKK